MQCTIIFASVSPSPHLSVINGTSHMILIKMNMVIIFFVSISILAEQVSPLFLAYLATKSNYEPVYTVKCLQQAHISKSVIDAMRSKILLIRFRKETKERIELQRILIIALFRNKCIFICFNSKKY